MNESQSWLKNTALLVLLMSVPVLVASFPSKDPAPPQSEPALLTATEKTTLAGVTPQDEAADVAVATFSPPADRATEPEKSVADNQDAVAQHQPAAPSNTEQDAGTDADKLEPAAAAADQAIDAGPPPGNPPVATEQPSFSAWQKDFDISIRKLVTAQILVQIAEHSELLDNDLIELERLQAEVELLRRKLDYLDNRKLEWQESVPAQRSPPAATADT